MQYQAIPGGHAWILTNGATVTLHNLAVHPGGKLWGQVTVVGDGGVLGGGALDLTSVRERRALAQSLASRNGNDPQAWDDILLSIYAALQAQAAAGPSLRITNLADVTPKPVDWLWPGRIPKAKLTIIGGDPGLGKSWLTLAAATAISLGAAWPDGGRAPQGNVLLVSGEDGLEDTVQPRLAQMEADLSRIAAIAPTVKDGDAERVLSLADHLALLEGQILAFQASLLALDPLLGFMGKRSDTHRSSDVRAVLSPLASMAERTGCAILGVFHLNKNSSEQSSIYRFTASLDFTAAARSVLLVGKHPEDADRRALAGVKCNLSALPDSLGFHIEAGRFFWDGTVPFTADDILAAPPLPPGALEGAVDFLRGYLASGPQLAKLVEAAADALGIAKRTLDRARQKLGVVAEPIRAPGKAGIQGWNWRLPDQQGV